MSRPHVPVNLIEERISRAIAITFACMTIFLAAQLEPQPFLLVARPNAITTFKHTGAVLGARECLAALRAVGRLVCVKRAEEWDGYVWLDVVSEVSIHTRLKNMYRAP